MSGLSAADREALRGLGQGQVPAVVEAIVAAHVKAALEQAADEIEARMEAMPARGGNLRAWWPIRELRSIAAKSA